MKKIFAFIILVFSVTVSSSMRDCEVWFPDFTPECERNESLRDAYLENEQEAVKKSLAEMEKHGINIIPTPKNIVIKELPKTLSRGKIRENVKIYADKSSSIAAGLISKKLGFESEIQAIPGSISESPISIILLRADVNRKNKLLPEKIPDYFQGYSIITRDKAGKRTYILAGKDYTGLLYAAVTLSQSIKDKDSTFIFPHLKVIDWPDIRYRNGGGLHQLYKRNFRFTSNKDTTEAKNFIDWLLEHKINMTTAGGILEAQKKKKDLDDELKWLNEISSYAKKRGIIVELRFKANIGTRSKHKNNPEYNRCVQSRGKYFCWSSHELLKKRAAELAELLKRSGTTSIFIHSVDTVNSLWHKRCEQCKKLYGDDRFKADAEMFNIFRNELRKDFPDMPIIIVPRPYSFSIDYPKHVECGEMKNKNDLKRFSEMLAEDLYVCHREANRRQSLSWVNGFRQPMHSCVMAWYIRPWLSGRDFTMMCRFYKTYNYPLSNEIASYGVAGSSSKDKIQCLGFSEFTWNLNAPGAAEYGHTPEIYVDIFDPFGPEQKKNVEIQKFLKRAANNLFGEKYGKFFYNYYTLLTDLRFVDDHRNVKYDLTSPSRYGIAKMPGFDNKKCLSLFKRNYENSKKIIKDLETLKTKSENSKIQAPVNWHLMVMYPNRAISHIYSLALEADKASREGKNEKAAELIEKAYKAYEYELKELDADWIKIKDGVNDFAPKVYPKSWAEKKVSKHKNNLDLFKLKIQSRALMDKKRVKLTNKKEEVATRNLPVRAAVFFPDTKGGKTYGARSLCVLLKSVSDINVSEIYDLSTENLKKFDCLIFPDCKKLGKTKINIDTLRNFVIENGGGIYFEHDSCGYHRSPLNASLFPAIMERLTGRTGKPLYAPDYQEKDRIFTIVKEHPVTSGFPEGTKFTQTYFDHMQLKNSTGSVLLRDSYQKPVFIAGEVGKGKVLFNGAITLAPETKELQKPLEGVEGRIIVNSIYWLSNVRKGTSLIFRNISKKDTTLTDRDATVITFIPEIKPCREIKNAKLYVQCFDARNLKKISKRREIANFKVLSNNWISEDIVKIETDVTSSIKVVMELVSDKGKKLSEKIIK